MMKFPFCGKLNFKICFFVPNLDEKPKIFSSNEKFWPGVIQALHFDNVEPLNFTKAKTFCFNNIETTILSASHIAFMPKSN